MRKIFLLSYLFLVVHFVHANTNAIKDTTKIYYSKGYHGIVEAGYAFKIDVPELNYFKFNFVNSYKFSNAAVGLGFGLRVTDYRESILIPVFLDFRFYITKTPTAPYINMAVGHSFSTDGRVSGGVYLNGTIGANFLLLSNKNAIHMGLGYEIQDINARFFKLLSFNLGTSF